MSREPFTYDVRSSERTLSDIETMLDDLARRARTELPPRQFYSELLAASVRALAAIAAAVWTKNAMGAWQVEYHLHLDELELESSAAARLAHDDLLAEVAATRMGKTVSPHFHASAGSDERGRAGNLSPYVLVLMPVVVAGEAAAILEVVVPPGGSAGSERGYLRVLSALAEVAGDFQQGAQLRELQAAQAQWQQLAHFARTIHASLDTQATAYTLANEARRLVGCDRACVLVQERNLALKSVSGAETFDPRANFVRRVEDLAAAALVTKEDLWVEDDLRGLPPEVELPLQAYLDECHSRSLGILPLLSAGSSDGEPRILGALVVEQFQAGFNTAVRQRASFVRDHGAVALRNSLELERLPLSGIMRRVAAARWWLQAQRLPRAMAMLGALVVGMVVLTFWPAELKITARGELQPAMRREVFAPLDGVVQRIDIQHGQQVPAGKILAVLRSPDLELQQRRVEGERQTAQKRLESLAAARVGKRFTTDQELQEYRKLTAEEAEVKAELAGLAEQQKILERQAAELTVKSPLAGEVLSWDIANQLMARPVARGQSLLTIAEVTGPWVLELQLPDEQSGHVLAAYKSAQAEGRRVPIEYMLATRPGEKLPGQIQSIAESTEADRENRPSVRVTIALDDSRLPDLRPGATAVATIDCGPHALGYVWLHDLIDAVRTWLFF